MLTQLTYEGLLDEIFEIQNCAYLDPHWLFCHLTLLAAHIKVDPALLSTQTGASTAGSTSGVSSSTNVTKRKHHLHSTDRLFAHLRDENFAAVGPKLNKEAKRLDSEYRVCLHVFTVFISYTQAFLGTAPSPDNQPAERFRGKVGRLADRASSCPAS
jgi:hypothetical protein